MALIGRIKRLTQYLGREMEKAWAKHGINAASFDVLATVRRSGKPYSLTPSELIGSTMVTSGTMTNRIDQLAKVGFVERVPNPSDGRGFLIALTDRGFAVIDEAVTEHVATQERLVTGLSPQAREQLDGLLRSFLTNIEMS